MKKNKMNNPFIGIPGMSAMRCPYCGSPVVLRSADGIYKENHANTKLYVCSRYPACDAYVRVHEGTNKPVGSLADHRLKGVTRKGIDAMIFMSEGFTCREIGEMYGTNANNVTAWISKARKALRLDVKFMRFAAELEV